MNIEIKKSVKPVNYIDAINIMEERLEQIFNNKERELIWTLEHKEIYTAGTSYSEKDIRKFINSIEKTIIETLKTFDIETFSDKDNIGIWHNENGKVKKIAAIGVRVKKWIAYHGFAVNINNNLNQYKKIIPCGIKDKGITNLVEIRKKDYSKLEDLLIEKFILNLRN